MNEGEGFILKDSGIFRFFCGSPPATEASCQKLLSFSEGFCQVEAEAAVLFQAKLCTIWANKMQKNIFSDWLRVATSNI